MWPSADLPKRSTSEYEPEPEKTPIPPADILIINEGSATVAHPILSRKEQRKQERDYEPVRRTVEESYVFIADKQLKEMLDSDPNQVVNLKRHAMVASLTSHSYHVGRFEGMNYAANILMTISNQPDVPEEKSNLLRFAAILIAKRGEETFTTEKL